MRAVFIGAVTGGIYLLAILACPISMGLMMWFMGRGMGSGRRGETRSQTDGGSLDELKAEQARLAQRISVLDGERSQAPGLSPSSGEAREEVDAATARSKRTPSAAA